MMMTSYSPVTGYSGSEHVELLAQRRQRHKRRLSRCAVLGRRRRVERLVQPVQLRTELTLFVAQLPIRLGQAFEPDADPPGPQQRGQRQEDPGASQK
jgi:hypothetical protein